MLSSLKELIEEPELVDADDPEEKFTTSGVSWENYETLLAKLQYSSYYRVTYLDGILEIVSPSKRHESAKTRFSFLLSFYLWKKKIRHFPFGSTTFKNKAKKAGAEPDECYCLFEEKDVPDLAIEVVFTSGSVSKLEIYRRLGVPEVWFWQSDKLKLYHLRDNSQKEEADIFTDTYGYEEITKSELLPELDIALLVRCVLITDSIQANDEFEKNI
ncbi:MAG: Uma2 family endonuclease [Scytonematopsis contorta HA4267-MV1]|jgi:Uma2 family endonuclease|nr:Uma2 family endonuclease [Scytonematopsis contorta HA4267-MV1]